jgi:RNA polymerase sigma factor (sigma-70 family)
MAKCFKFSLSILTGWFWGQPQPEFIRHLFGFRGHVEVMNMMIMDSAEASDEQLWKLSHDGDHEAFARIVERYQSLICALAFSACGSLATSEDLAQETFLTAWRRLGELREPQKLRHWLCGIVRNLAANASRRDFRRGGAPASLEAVEEEASQEADPAAQAVTREEETLLWRALAGMPRNYREPMVLFYREQQSIAEVSAGLDLSEDAVKQRLSRGRAMLRDELATLVESTLRRTRPTAAFTAGVLAALSLVETPGASAATATGAVVGKGVAAGIKGVLGSAGLGAVVGPAIGLLVAFFSSKAAASTARSPQERKCIMRYSLRIIVFCWVMSVGLVLALVLASKLYETGRLQSLSPLWPVLGVLAWVAALVLTIMWWSSRMQREVSRIRDATGTDDQAYAKELSARGFQLKGPWLYESKLRFLGLPVLAFACGGSDASSYRPRKAVGWIALGDVALSPFLAMGGFAIAPVALGSITFGVLSLSIFWAIGVGVFACGSVAVGWWAYGLGALGWKAAAGCAVLAKHYALGPLARGSEANTPAAHEWFRSQWLADPMNLLIHNAHWLLLLCVATALCLRMWRGRQLGRLSSQENRPRLDPPSARG